MTAKLDGMGRVTDQIHQYYSFDKIPAFNEPLGVEIFSDVYIEAVCQKVFKYI